jgi:hypothetical protein
MIPGLRLKPDVEVGDLVTAFSVLVALAGLLIALLNERGARRREYADRIRRAAARCVAALERWSAIIGGFYDDIQPLITETDSYLVRTQDITATRDRLWRELVAIRARTLHRVFAEKVEIAYAGLYGYDARVEALYKTASVALQTAESDGFHDLLEETQQAVMCRPESGNESAELGNDLREIAYVQARRANTTITAALEPFRAAMLMLLNAEDRQLVKKQIKLPPAP